LEEEVEESVIAKSTGEHEEEDIAPQDAALFRHLETGKKISKEEANYRKQEEIISQDGSHQSCIKCKFNLPDEKLCHIEEGKIDNEYGVSKFFSPKGDGMLPGDVLWDFIKKTGKNWNIKKDMQYQKVLRDFSAKTANITCILAAVSIRGSNFTPEMSCAFVVKIGNGTEIQVGISFNEITSFCI